MTYICSKEVELKGIKDDVSYIKKAIAGNGEEGILRSLNRNTEFRLKATASITMLKWLVTSGIILTIFNIIVSIS